MFGVDGFENAADAGDGARGVCCDAETSGIVEEAAAALADRLRSTGRSVALAIPPCEALELFGIVSWHDAWMRACQLAFTIVIRSNSGCGLPDFEVLCLTATEFVAVCGNGRQNEARRQEMG